MNFYISNRIRKPIRGIRPCLAVYVLTLSFCYCNGICCQAQMMSNATNDQNETVGFDQVQPILRKRCQSCHNPEELRGDLSVTDIPALKAGSSSGPVIVAGKPRESMLYTTAAHLDEPTMPPNSRKIPARELEVIRRWIEDGLVAKSGMSPTASTAKDSLEADTKAEPQMISPVLQSTSISALAAHPTDGTVAFAGNRQIVLLDARSGELTGAIPVEEPEITNLRFSRDGTQLLAALGVPGLSGTIRGFDVKSGREIFQALDENDSILALDCSPNSQLIAVGGPSKVMRVASLSGEVKHTFKKPTDWVLTNRFSPDGLLVATGDRFGGLFVCETESGELFWNLRGHTGPVHGVAWDCDQETLLSAGADGKIRVWNMHHGELTAQWDAQVGGILTLGRSKGLTVAAGRSGKITAWRSPVAMVAEFQTDEQIENVELLPNLDRMVASDASGKIHLLSLPDLKPISVVTLPKQERVMEELLVRLEERKAAFEASERVRIAEEARAVEIANAENSADVQAAAEQLLLSSSGRPIKLTAISDALEEEVKTLRASVLKQQETLANLKRQQSMLDDQIRTQAELIVLGEKQVERLETILSVSRGAMDQMQVKTLQAQAEEQKQMLGLLYQLQQQSASAAKNAEALPNTNRPEWGPTRKLLGELTRTIRTEAEKTERQLKVFGVPTNQMSGSEVAEATK